MDLSNFKSTQFVSQYAGLPVDEFLQSASALQQRGQQNQEKLDQLEIMANNIQTMDIDQNVKQSRLAEIDKQMTALAESGAYEHAAAQVRTQARDFARDEELMDASANYSKLQKMKAEAKAQGATQIQLQYLDNAIASYNRGGGAAGGSNLAEVSFYKEANLAKEVDIILNGQKADGSVISNPNGKGYIVTSSNKEVTEEDLRKQAIAYLSGDPKFSRQIEDMAKLNIYNTTLSSTNDPETAMATYESADAGTLDTEIGGVIDRLITPAVDKYSFKEYGRQLSADPLAEARSSRKPDGSIPIASKSDVLDLGNIPNNAKEFRSKQEETSTTIKTLTASIAQAEQNGNTREAAQLRNQLSAAQTNKAVLDKVYNKYVSKIENPKVKVGIAIRMGIESGLFDLPNSSASTLTADDFDPMDDPMESYAKGTTSERLGQILSIKDNEQFRQWAQETYNVSPQQIDEEFEKGQPLGIYQKGADDRWFDMGTDFDSYLDDHGQTTEPQIYNIDNKELRDKASQALSTDAVTFYEQGSPGPVDKNADLLRTAPYEVVGVSAMTAEGTLYTVKMPDDLGDPKKYGAKYGDISDYAGRILYVKPSNASTINQVVGEEMYNEVIGAATNTGGGMMAATGAEAFLGMMGTPNQFEKPISLIGTTAARGNSTTIMDPTTNEPLADVTQNDNGFYTVELTFSDGSSTVVKDLGSASEAAYEVQAAYDKKYIKD